jgi:hypothetical protein
MMTENKPLIETLEILKESKIKLGYALHTLQNCKSEVQAYATGYDKGQVDMINLILRMIRRQNGAE